MKPLVLVVAVSRNGVIGKGGRLPWHLPEDLKHFKRVTMGHAMIMGRRTWDSIGRALPGRRSIVVTRNRELLCEGAEIAPSFDAAVAKARETDPEPRVIGGADIFAAALPAATRIYLTEVLEEVDGDAHFPPWDRREWRVAEARDGDGVRFLTLDRASPAG